MHLRKISGYIILLAISLLFFVQQPTWGQTSQPKNDIQKKQSDLIRTDSVSLFRGVALSVDLFGPGAYLFGSDFGSGEVAVEVNLANRFFPIVEIGYGKTDATDEDSQIHYKTASPYFRVGMNYNVQYKRQRPDYIYAGVRLGFTSFKYDVEGPEMEDPIWGEKIPFGYNELQSHAIWGELLVGIKTQVYKNFYMGWSFRYRINGYVKKSTYAEPWYIPGFGANSNTKFAASYNLIYYIPW